MGNARRIARRLTGAVGCGCADPGCPVCRGSCRSPAKTVLVRIDMDDRDGTPFCQECAGDAMDSGVFSESISAKIRAGV